MKLKLSNETYDTLKWIAQEALPAVITFYGVIGVACNIPYTTTVLTIAAGFDTMLGRLLGVSTNNYNKED